ncbi:MFS transporter [Sphingobium sp. JS3065]|uniref:MFS transporter n=1 Tax=Sphingobium sp. JS3065 TaxID=2970925 RepID=UPI00226541AA|nr:MFS transporter [Sphingobium sp. JS3065]UZW55365.1 MFS transporter [Sphingobium sp. JS3065]
MVEIVSDVALAKVPALEKPFSTFLGNQQAKRSIIGSFLGMTLESYDFLLYGAATATVFAPLFFSSLDSGLASLLALLTFAAGFLTRPLGGLFFGHFGDKIGRKPMMIISLALIGSATTIIGLLPTYDQIGAAAPIALVAMRLIQGFALGGEYGGAILMSVEHAPARKKGFVGALTQAGTGLGLILATVIMLLSAHFTGDKYMVWGWRIPFLLASVMFLIGIYIRRFSTETPGFLAIQAQHKLSKAPLVKVVKRYPKEILLISIIFMTAQGNFYVATVFMASYAATFGVPASTMLLASAVSSVFQIFGAIFAGMLSDKFGRAPVMVTAAFAIAVMIIPLFLVMSTQSTLLITAALSLMVLAQSAFFGPCAALITESFSPEVRYSGVSIGASLGAILGGGVTVSVVATLIRANSGAITWAVAYLVCLTTAGAICVLFLKNRRWDPGLSSAPDATLRGR